MKGLFAYFNKDTKVFHFILSACHNSSGIVLLAASVLMELRTSGTKLSCSWTGFSSLTQNIRAQYHRRQSSLIQPKKAHYRYHLSFYLVVTSKLMG